MATFQGLDAAVRQVLVDVRGQGIEAARKHFIAAARAGRDEVIDQAVRRAGQAPETRQAVDGQLGAQLESVKPGGRITFGFDYGQEVVQTALMLLRHASPIASGKYRDGHRVMESATLIYTTWGGGLPGKILAIISNDVPYSRRIEIGIKKDGTPFVTDTPPRVYERVAKDMAKRFDGDMLDVGYWFVEIAGGYVIKGRLHRRVSYKANRRSKGFRQGKRSRILSNSQHKGKAVRYPAIVITRKVN